MTNSDDQARIFKLCTYAQTSCTQALTLKSVAAATGAQFKKHCALVSGDSIKQLYGKIKKFSNAIF
jgi:hypothetical protein